MNKPEKIFVSDGCSGFMSFLWQIFSHHAPPWEGHCLTHDRAYYEGGELSLRLEADKELLKGVIDNGHPYWAIVMFLAVRIGGVYWLPFPSVRKINGRWRLFLTGVRWGWQFDYPKYK